MKYFLILFLITFTVYAQEAPQIEPVPYNCWYTNTGYMCGDYKDDDPTVLAKAECKIGPSVTHPRGHVKLKGDGKVECPVVFDSNRKAQADAALQAVADKQTLKNEAIDRIKGKSESDIRAMGVPEKLGELMEMVIDLRKALDMEQ